MKYVCIDSLVDIEAMYNSSYSSQSKDENIEEIHIETIYFISQLNEIKFQ